MSKPVIVFDDQEIARSEQSTPYVTDRRCWLPHPRGVCNGRLRMVAFDAMRDALLCDECGSVYDLHLEMLGTSSYWGGDIQLEDDNEEMPMPVLRGPRRPLFDDVPDDSPAGPRLETMLDSLIRAQREMEMYGADEGGDR